MKLRKNCLAIFAASVLLGAVGASKTFAQSVMGQNEHGLDEESSSRPNYNERGYNQNPVDQRGRYGSHYRSEGDYSKSNNASYRRSNDNYRYRSDDNSERNDVMGDQRDTLTREQTGTTTGVGTRR